MQESTKTHPENQGITKVDVDGNKEGEILFIHRVVRHLLSSYGAKLCNLIINKVAHSMLFLLL